MRKEQYTVEAAVHHQNVQVLLDRIAGAQAILVGAAALRAACED